jgi:hypothetical protein
VTKLRHKSVTPEIVNSILGLFSKEDMDRFMVVIGDSRRWSLDECYLFSLACMFYDGDSESEHFDSVLTLSEWAHEVFWIRTCPHTLQQIVRDGIDQIVTLSGFRYLCQQLAY